MIEGISAVTLGTHEMRRAVRFYRALGFEILHGGEESSFTSFRVGKSYRCCDGIDHGGGGGGGPGEGLGQRGEERRGRAASDRAAVFARRSNGPSGCFACSWWRW